MKGLAFMMALVVTILGLAGLALAQRTNPVKITTEIGKIDETGKQLVLVRLQIEKGWYIYANPIGLEELKALETKIIVIGKNPPALKVEYPVGKEENDKLVGIWKKYEGETVIRVFLERGKKPAEAVTLRVSYCPNKESVCCMPPMKIDVRIP